MINPFYFKAHLHISGKLIGKKTQKACLPLKLIKLFPTEIKTLQD